MNFSLPLTALFLFYFNHRLLRGSPYVSLQPADHWLKPTNVLSLTESVKEMEFLFRECFNFQAHSVVFFRK